MSKNGAPEMSIVTLQVSSRKAFDRNAAAAFAGKKHRAVISFATAALLFKVLSGKRWQLLNIMTGAGAMTIREAARRVHRDVKAVHGDVHALLRAGILSRTDDGHIIFLYDALHVDFMLNAA
jgi:predicted transcriptional regulator